MMKPDECIQLYRAMKSAREIDRRERILVSQNLAHFHVSGAGHEASACLARHLAPTDWLHLHYRDKAFLLARGLPIEEFFRSLLARANSHSAGRQMSAHFSERSLNVLSMVGPVGNNALQAVGVASSVKNSSERSIVICSVGDGTTQQGEFLEAVAEAVRWQLPVMFLIEDNKYSISTTTKGRTFFDLPSGPASDFYGLKIHRLDGTDAIAVDARVCTAISEIRTTRQPQIVILEVDRLENHTNADDQTLYRNESEIQIARANSDPVANLRDHLVRIGVSSAAIESLDAEIRCTVDTAAENCLGEEVAEPGTPNDATLDDSQNATRGDGTTNTSDKSCEYTGDASTPRLTMREALNRVLRHHLATDDRVFLYGQDIEDPKGDVFGVTRGLSTEFPDRVVNAPLSESTILGTAIGRALTGQRPVAFIQFADFLPLAFNQIVSELGSMHWRTNGAWQCPVIVMATCGAYRQGLGPFHAQTMEAFCAHVPGIDVFLPSTAGDAAGLLNAAFKSNLPTIFLYPKSCLNLSNRTTSVDVSKQFAVRGCANHVRLGSDLTLVSWGNTVGCCEEAADALAKVGYSTDLIDLRTLAPWDKNAVLKSARKTGRLLVVHEDNHTNGFGAEVVATVAEYAGRPVTFRRIARPDSYIPCNFDCQSQLLPGLRQILVVCSELLSCELTWESEPNDSSGQIFIRAIGSGPADEMVDVVNVYVSVGDHVKRGQVVAELEATKSVVELVSDTCGTVTNVLAGSGDRVRVGGELLCLQSNQPDSPTQPHHTPARKPVFRRREGIADGRTRSENDLTRGSSPLLNGTKLYVTSPEALCGSQDVSTESLASRIPGWSAAEAIKRTGVIRRPWVSSDETAASMTLKVATRLLERFPTGLPQISAVFCSTTSPQEATPSIACSVATGLAKRHSECFAPDWFALDLNAACSGFLYALRLAADHLVGNPDNVVLLLTSEILSPNINPTDPSTAFLFADASTATLVSLKAIETRSLVCSRPLLRSAADPDRVISSPCFGSDGFLRMDGIAVARTAYKTMASIMTAAATADGLELSDLRGVIPHPGSGRIIQNVSEMLGVSPSNVWNTLKDTGNTSSSSIPLALHRHWNELPASVPLGLVAFGAGFTSAATTCEMKDL